MHASIVFDIGGTSTRAGIYVPKDKKIEGVAKVKSPNFLNFKSKEKLIEKLTSLIVNISNNLICKFPQYNIKDIGISFPGPISDSGIILCAPTLWGELINNFDLKAILSKKLEKLNVYIANDITAAGWRYLHEFDGNFCIITVSSGVGCKVFANYNLLLSKEGLGGELGHHYIRGEYENIICDCGQKGHIGSISSGRGIEKLTLYLREKYAEKYQNSPLMLKETITTYDIVNAINEHDEFSEFVLNESIIPIADAIACLYSFIGIKKYLFVGGFALAVGDQYVNAIKKVLHSKQLLGISVEDIENMIVLGNNDDDSGLIGMGKYIDHKNKKGVSHLALCR